MHVDRQELFENKREEEAIILKAKSWRESSYWEER